MVVALFFEKAWLKNWYLESVNSWRPGKSGLLKPPPEESAAAKARLDEVRKKRRERHASKKIKYKWTVIEIKNYSYNNNYSKFEEKSLDNNLKNIVCKTGRNIFIR